MNAALLRAVLDHVTGKPHLLDTTTYAEFRPSGEIAADIAGRALLLSGWTLAGDDAFLSPDGLRELDRPEDIEDEAQALLGLTDDETWNGGDLDKLFDLPREAAAGRLRELTGTAEAAKVNG